MDERVAAVVVAAGDGQRAGLAGNKVLALLAGRPLVTHAVDALRAHPSVGEIVLVLRPEDRPLMPPLEVRVVDGGPTRGASVLAGLEALAGRPDRVVLVHDGARPLARPEDVERVLAALEGADGAALAVRVEEALKRVGPDGLVETSPDRRDHWLARTPQAYRLDLLRRALRANPASEDCAAAVPAAGGRVRLVEGARDNLKVTWPDDLALAEFFLSRRLRTRSR